MKKILLMVAALNIILLIGLSFPFEAAGVIIVTPLARCCINVWYMLLVHWIINNCYIKLMILQLR